jgi:cell division protein FtsI/penicillin-binding protein 2
LRNLLGMSHRRTAALTLVAVSVPLLAAGCTSSAPGPQGNAAAFLGAWAKQDWPAMRSLTAAAPADFVTVNAKAFGALSVKQATFTPGKLLVSGSTASEPVTEKLQLSGLGSISVATSLHLTQQQDGKWLVNWTPSTIIPQLKSGDHLRLRTIWPTRAAILGADGTPLAAHGQMVTIGLEGQLIKNRASLTSALIQAGATQAEVSQAITAAKANPTYFEPVFTVTRARYEQIAPAIYPLPGTMFQSGNRWQAITPGLASGLVGEMGPITAQEMTQLGAPYEAQNVVGQTGIQAAEERQLAGTPGADITVVDKAGTQVGTVATLPDHPGSAVQTTIDPRAQQAAEAALANEKKSAALVAVNAQTGKVLAAASVNAGFDLAVDGGFPPGSTFKILDSTALLQHGLTPSSAASCPKTITEDGEVFHNAEGDVPVSNLLQAFTESCNTAFIGLVSNNLSASEIRATAALYGIGKTMNIGVAAFSGSVPKPIDGADLAATSIGQGRVLVSPLNMAMVAAAVDTGTVRPPTLVSSGNGTNTTAATQLPAGVVSSLHALMASVVTSGTAAGQGLPAGTYAKTGTAEFGTTKPLKLDAWLVGFHGNIAFAALVVDSPGDGGPTCGPIVARFLDALP